jgi:hypothetical protein
VAFVRRTAPVALLLVGLLLLGSAVAGIARIDDPLRAAAVQSPANGPFEDVVDHHRGAPWRDGGGDGSRQRSGATGSDGC